MPTDLRALLPRLERLYSGVVSDALDRRGIRDKVMQPTVRPLYPEARVVGIAATVLAHKVWGLSGGSRSPGGCARSAKELRPKSHGPASYRRNAVDRSGSKAVAFPRRLKILLIEDNANLREVVAQMLAQDGHTVLEAANGWEGLAILQAAESVDLVLTDLKMPGLSGWEVVRAIRACWPGLRVGLLTGTPDALVEQREPVDLVITKPVSLETLRNAVACLDAQER